jgi:hypothetical protein
VPVGGTPGSDGFAVHTLLGASAIGIARNDPDGTARVATVLIGLTGKPLTPPGQPSFLLDVPGGVFDTPSAAAFTWGGQLYLSGATYPADFATGAAFIARLDLDGSIDEAFAGGIITHRESLEYAAFNDLKAGPEGVLAAGWDFGEQPATLPPSNALLARYRKDGSLDAAFGTNGVVLHDFRNGAKECGPLVHPQ